MSISISMGSRALSRSVPRRGESPAPSSVRIGGRPEILPGHGLLDGLEFRFRLGNLPVRFFLDLRAAAQHAQQVQADRLCEKPNGPSLSAGTNITGTFR